MNLDKSKKRIAKKIKMGFQGYPAITIAYFGESAEVANTVSVIFQVEEGAELQEERFNSSSDAREDEVLQSALVKMIERSGAKTVSMSDGVAIAQ